MFICICHAISEMELRELASKGAKTLDDISSCCGAGNDCGSCVRKIEKILAQEMDLQSHEIILDDRMILQRERRAV